MSLKYEPASEPLQEIVSEKKLNCTLRVAGGWVRDIPQCSGSEAGSYLRLIDFVYHSTVALRVIKKRRSNIPQPPNQEIVSEKKLTCTLRVAGGWVRDKLMGGAPHDIDIAVTFSFFFYYSQA